MTNREWLLNKMQNMSDDELADVFEDNTYICELKECEETASTHCENCVVNWLKAEHKEKITLSEAERIILENIDKDYKWIAKDKKGGLYLYTDKPHKYDSIEYWDSSKGYIEFDLFNHLFQFITWNDEEPYNIEELLNQ